MWWIVTLIRLGFFGYAISGGGGFPRDLGRHSRDRDEILHTRRPGRNLHDCVVRFFKIINYANLFIKLLFSP